MQVHAYVSPIGVWLLQCLYMQIPCNDIELMQELAEGTS